MQVSIAVEMQSLYVMRLQAGKAATAIVGSEDTVVEKT
jgi:hypothetical protein